MLKARDFILERGDIVDRGNTLQLGLDGLESSSFDLAFIHATGIEVANLLPVGAGLSFGVLGSFLENFMEE